MTILLAIAASAALGTAAAAAPDAPVGDPIGAAIEQATALSATDPRAAAEALEAVLPQLPQDHRMHLWAGDLRLEAGDLTQARAHYQAAAAISGGDPASTRGLAAVRAAKGPVLDLSVGGLTSNWSGHPELRGVTGGRASADLWWGGPTLHVSGSAGAQRVEAQDPVPWGELWLGAGWQARRFGVEAVGVMTFAGTYSLGLSPSDGAGPGPGGDGAGPGGVTSATEAIAGQATGSVLQNTKGGGLRGRYSPWGDLVAEGSILDNGTDQVLRGALLWRSPELALGPVGLAVEPGGAVQGGGEAGTIGIGFATLYAATGPVRVWGGGMVGEQSLPLVLGLRSVQSWAGNSPWGAWAGAGVDLGAPAGAPLSLDAGWSFTPLEQIDPFTPDPHQIEIHAFTLSLSTRVGGS